VAGKKLSLYTYTNAEEVELVLNGRSLGKKQNPKEAKRRNQIHWDGIEYQPGYLEAIARNAGKVVARHRIETTGEAVKLTAEADKNAVTTKKAVSSWKADGQDLLHVKVVAVDQKGRRVQIANQEVTFAVEGEAEIVGVVNGDINSNELHVANKRSLFNGTCTVILRSTRKAGPVTLTATASGLKPIKMKWMSE
jgi:beta-galactosidase